MLKIKTSICISKVILFHDIKIQSSNNFKTENRIESIFSLGKFSDSSKISYSNETLLESENFPSIRLSVLKLLEDWVLISWNKICSMKSKASFLWKLEEYGFCIAYRASIIKLF